MLPNGDVAVADFGNHRIRRIHPDGTVTTLAGCGCLGTMDGPALQACFAFPCGLAVTYEGELVVSDYGSHRIRKIGADGVVSTLAGFTQGFKDARGKAACFNQPAGLAVTPGGHVVIADSGNHRIRLLHLSGQVTTVAGRSSYGHNDGPALEARFHAPKGVAVRGSSILVADYGSHLVTQHPTHHPPWLVLCSPLPSHPDPLRGLADPGDRWCLPHQAPGSSGFPAPRA